MATSIPPASPVKKPKKGIGSAAGGGTTGNGGTSTAPPAPPDIQAQRDPRLEGLANQYGGYVEDIRSGTGEIADIVGGRARDAMAGVQQSAIQSAELRGAPVDMAQLAAEENRAVQGALGDVRLQREALLGSALSGAVGAAQAPASLALQEKGLGLDAYRAYQDAMSSYNAAIASKDATAYNQLLAVLEAQRSSPIYDPALAAQPQFSSITSYGTPAEGTNPFVTSPRRGGTIIGAGGTRSFV